MYLVTAGHQWFVVKSIFNVHDDVGGDFGAKFDILIAGKLCCNIDIEPQFFIFQIMCVVVPRSYLLIYGQPLFCCAITFYIESGPYV